jgi:LysM repeat protein
MVIVMNGTIQYTIRPYDTIWMLAQVFNTTVDAIMELNPGIDPRNLLIGQVVTIRPGYQHYPPYPNNANDNGTVVGSELEELTNYFRLLWEQHVEWTRMAVMGMVHELPESDLITQRLLRNPEDFANAIVTFYGEEAAHAFEQLFTAHITIAAELVQAAMAGNNEAATDADQRWHENADQIAELLASMNPYWSVDDWSAMLYEHLELLSTNVSQMIAGNYEDSINGYDMMELQALEMADMMAEGIAMQFPG